jgi:hypothetical protein
MIFDFSVFTISRRAFGDVHFTSQHTHQGTHRPRLAPRQMKGGFFGSSAPKAKKKPVDGERGGAATAVSAAAAVAVAAATKRDGDVVKQEWPHGHRFVPSPDGYNDNLLVMLHGRGDTPAPFASLATKLNLPCTAALILAGPLEVPFTDGGREWFVNMVGRHKLTQA